MIRVFIILSFVSLLSVQSFGQACPASGTISSNCTVTGNLSINGVSRTVNSGVTVTVTGNVEVTNNGTLNATGAVFNITGNLTDGYNTLNTINGGTYNCTSVSAASGGGFTMSGATVVATGSLSFNGDAITINNSTLSGSSFATNLSSLSMSSTAISVTGNFGIEDANATNCDFYIGGTLSINSGTTTFNNTEVDAGQNLATTTTNYGVSFNGGGVLNANNGTQMNVRGSVQNNEWYVDNSNVVVTGNFDNAGSEVLVVRNNGSISIGGNFDNSGSGNVAANNGGVMEVAGNYNNSGGGSTSTSGGAIVIGGSYTGTAPSGDGSGCGSGGGGCCGSACSTLPVTLLYFEAHPSSNGVLLTWSTATESNNHYFSLLRSQTGLDYEEIAIIQGGGSTKDKRSYSFTDFNVPEGIVYYVLKQTDFDGKFEEFRPVVIRSNFKLGSQSQLSLYPSIVMQNEDVNLVPNWTYEDFSAVIYVFDFTGRRINQVRTINEGSTLKILISDLQLTSGVYFLKGVISNQKVNVKFIQK